MDTRNTQIDARKLALSPNDTAKVLGISRAQLWKLHAGGKLPLPVYLGSKAPRWAVSELQDWLAAGAPDLATWQRLQGVRQ